MAAPQVTVLLVEDDGLIRFALATHLEDQGFEVIEAANGEQAIGLLGRAADVLVTDIMRRGDP
jgi:CheY-like chemotaxis protein